MPEVVRLRGAGVELVATGFTPAGARRGVVLLLHGGGQTRHSWSETGDALSARGWQALAVDLRGHGDSPWSATGTYEFEDYVADLRALVAALDEVPVLVGASLGGLTALVAEGESGPLARALVLVDVVPRLEPEGLKRVRTFMSGTVDGFADVQEAVAAVASYNPHRATSATSAGLERNLRRRPDGRLGWHWDPAFLGMTQHDHGQHMQVRARAAAGGVTVPTLLLRGAQSDVVSEAGVEELRRLVPGARAQDVAGTGHMVAGDDNDAFTGRLLRFLDALPPV